MSFEAKHEFSAAAERLMAWNVGLSGQDKIERVDYSEDGEWLSVGQDYADELSKATEVNAQRVLLDHPEYDPFDKTREV